MDKLQKQIDLIKKQRRDLETKLQDLMDQRNTDLVAIIKSISPPNLDIYVLVGGILEVIEGSRTPSDKVEDWRKAGQKFCRNYRSQKAKAAAKKNNSNE